MSERDDDNNLDPTAEAPTERTPGYPHHPEFYAGRPDSDPEKRYIIAHGGRFQDGRYLGGFTG
jgi:hypothetical protein